MEVLDGYRPRGVPENDWNAVRPAVAALLDPLDDTVAKRARMPLGQLAVFAHRQGHEVTAGLLLDETLLAQWVATLDSPSTAATLRWAIRRVATHHRPERAAAHQPLTYARDVPELYTPDDITRMLTHAATLPTEHRQVAAAGLVLAGAGAGLDGQDLRTLPGEAVRRRADGLVVAEVTGSRRTRTVAVLDRYADALADIADRAHLLRPGRPLLGNAGGNVTAAAVELYAGWGGPKVTARRLRLTWLATHLTAGTRLPVLMAQAGISSLKTLDNLAAALALQVGDDEQTLTEAAQALR